MRWSGLKARVEDRFAESVKGRVAIYSTRYGGCTCGRAWITADGEEVANFCTRAKRNVEAGHIPQAMNLSGYGELSRQDAYEACWAFVHDMTIEEALADEDPLVQTLAVLDARIGRKRLARLDPETLHPLARSLLEVRRKYERA